MTVPPHVFEVGRETLRYARFERRKGALAAVEFRSVELPEASFHDGPLGGPIRDREAFDRSLGELLEALDSRPERACLLFPDRWLRTVVVDAGKASGAREAEVLRWRLKKLVPYPVEDLRVRGVRDSTGMETDDSKILVGFAIDQLVNELETLFGARGVRVGLVTNPSLGMAWALSKTPELRCVAVLGDEGYSLVFVRDRRTLLMRYKALDPTGLNDEYRHLVERDLRIMRGFFDDEVPDLALSRSLYCGPQEESDEWRELLEECLGAPALNLGEGDLRPSSIEAGQSWHVMAPLLGAAGTEVV